MAGYRKKRTYRTSEREMMIHKAQVLRANHWSVTEIAAELHIPYSHALAIVAVNEPEVIFNDLA